MVRLARGANLLREVECNVQVGRMTDGAADPSPNAGGRVSRQKACLLKMLLHVAAGARGILEGTIIDRELTRRGSRAWEIAEGISQDVLLLDKAKELGLVKPEAKIERIDELRQEAATLKRRADVGLLGERDRLRAKALKPLTEYGEALSEAGMPDIGGPVREPAERELEYRGWRQETPPRELAPDTRKLLKKLREPEAKEGRKPTWPPESSAAAEAAAGDFVGPPAELAGGEAPTTAPVQQVIHHHHGDTVNIGTQFAGPDRRHSGRGLRPKIGSGELDDRVPY